MKGNTGKILHVDLTTGSLAVETPDEMFYRRYVGGSCLGVYYVTRLTPIGADPLGPENVLAFTTSAVVGAPLSGNARHCVSAKSPLTGGIMSSEGGGYWGPESGLRVSTRSSSEGRRRNRPISGSTTGRPSYATPPRCGAK